MPPATDSIEDDIRAAMNPAGDDAGQATADALAPAADAPAPAEAPPPAAAPAAKTDAAGRVHGEGGKFVAKSGDPAQQSTPDQPAAASAEAPEPIRPPASWSATAKAQFAALDPLIQQEVLKRERDMDSGLAERAGKLKSYEPLDQVIEPYRAKMAMAGVEPHQAIQRLLAAQDVLDKNPLQGLLYLAQQYGVHPQVLAQALGQAPQRQALPPEFQAIQTELSTLKQTLTQREQAEAANKNQAIQSQIAAFRSDPANVYFDNVQNEMGALITAGQARDLGEAYTKACWANDEIRPLLIADQRKQEVAAANQRAKTARQAAGSVTGAPGAGQISTAANANASIEDDVRAAMADLSARA